jgi:DNA-binding transcriptional regulator YiaG
MRSTILPLAMSPSELKAVRARMGVTQVALAELLGVTWSTVARWETGQRRIPELAVRFLACLGRERQRRAKPRR